jgi:hypothetical protein
MQSKAHALVLKAIGFQAAESVRWSRTFLVSNIWEIEHGSQDDDSFSVVTSSDAMSVQSISTLGTLRTYVSSFTGSNSSSIVSSRDPEEGRGSMSRYRQLSMKRLAVPQNIVTTKTMVRPTFKKKEKRKVPKMDVSLLSHNTILKNVTMRI